jgi:hypothetical protein
MEGDFTKEDLTEEQKPQQPSEWPAHWFTPGISANPAGRPKKTEEEKELLRNIKSLGPKTYAAMVSMLDSERVSAVAKVKLIEIILSYILGKPESSVKLSVDIGDTVEISETRIQALIQTIKVGADPIAAEMGIDT